MKVITIIVFSGTLFCTTFVPRNGETGLEDRTNTKLDDWGTGRLGDWETEKWRLERCHFNTLNKKIATNNCHNNLCNLCNLWLKGLICVNL